MTPQHITHPIQLPAALRPVQAELHRRGFAVLERDPRPSPDSPLWVLVDGVERNWGVRPAAGGGYEVIGTDGAPASREAWLARPADVRAVGIAIEILTARRDAAPALSPLEEVEVISDWADAQAARRDPQAPSYMGTVWTPFGAVPHGAPSLRIVRQLGREAVAGQDYEGYLVEGALGCRTRLLVPARRESALRGLEAALRSDAAEMARHGVLQRPAQPEQGDLA